MFCTKCGKELQDGQLFCTGCGAKLSGAVIKSEEPANMASSEPVQHMRPAQSTEAPKQIYQPRPTHVNTTPKKKKSFWKIFLTVLVVFVLVVAIGIGGLVLLIKFAESDSFSYGFRKEDYMEDGYIDLDEDDSDKKKDDKNEDESQEAATVNEDVAGDKRQLLEEYVRENFTSVDGVYDTNMVCRNGYVDFEYTDKIPQGTIGYKIADFDSDGNDELLFVSIDSGYYFNIEIFEVKGKRVESVAKKMFQGVGDEVFSEGEGIVSFFTIEGNKILLESRSSVWLAADGARLCYEYLSYEDGPGIKVIAANSYVGSDGLDSGYVDALVAAGANNASWDEIFRGEKNPSDYLNNPELITNMSCVHTIDAREFQNWLSNAREGDTRIVSNVQISSSPLQPQYMYQSAFEAATSGEILADSSSRRLSKDDLRGLSKEECRIARNEIYARHGRIFDDEELRNHFRQFDWYEERISAGDFKESMLSDIEMYNRDLIVEYEKDMGYR